MARNVLVDAGFVVALLSSRDAHHQWAVTQASERPPPWFTCEAVLSEALYLLGELGTPPISAPYFAAALCRSPSHQLLDVIQKASDTGIRQSSWTTRPANAIKARLRNHWRIPLWD
jgi:predicted nucleic acid-binding protein